MASHCVSHSRLYLRQDSQIQHHQAVTTMSAAYSHLSAIHWSGEDSITRSPIVCLTMADGSINHSSWNRCKYCQVQANQTITTIHILQSNDSIFRFGINLFIRLKVICFSEADSSINLSYRNCWQLYQAQDHHAIAAINAWQDGIYGLSTEIFFSIQIPYIWLTMTYCSMDHSSIHLWQLSQVQAYHTITTMNARQDSIYHLTVAIILASQ